MEQTTSAFLSIINKHLSLTTDTSGRATANTTGRSDVDIYESCVVVIFDR